MFEGMFGGNKICSLGAVLKQRINGCTRHCHGSAAAAGGGWHSSHMLAAAYQPMKQRTTSNWPPPARAYSTQSHTATHLATACAARARLAVAPLAPGALLGELGPGRQQWICRSTGTSRPSIRWTKEVVAWHRASESEPRCAGRSCDASGCTASSGSVACPRNAANAAWRWRDSGSRSSLVEQ